jgi:hypothetical protein
MEQTSIIKFLLAAVSVSGGSALLPRRAPDSR